MQQGTRGNHNTQIGRRQLRTNQKGIQRIQTAKKTDSNDQKRKESMGKVEERKQASYITLGSSRHQNGEAQDMQNKDSKAV
jgi:hypothetical protein